MGTESSQRYQRRVVLVKKQLQLKYVGLILLCVLLSTVILAGDLYYTVYRISIVDNPALMPLMGQIQSMLWVKLVLFLGIVLLVALFVSHRIAGPLYRFEKSAQEVSTGDLTHRVSLRTGDELLDLQQEFNAMVSSLQALVQKDRTLARRLAGRVDQALRSLPEGADGARGELKALKAELDHLTSAFKV